MGRAKSTTCNSTRQGLQRHVPGAATPCAIHVLGVATPCAIHVLGVAADSYGGRRRTSRVKHSMRREGERKHGPAGRVCSPG